MFLKSVHYIQDPDVSKVWNPVQMEHQTAMTKVRYTKQLQMPPEFEKRKGTGKTGREKKNE